MIIKKGPLTTSCLAGDVLTLQSYSIGLNLGLYISIDRFLLTFTTSSLDISVKVFKEQYSRTFSGAQEVFMNDRGYV